MQPSKRTAWPIHIAFCVNERYLPYVTVAIRSISDTHHGTPVYVHILSDDIGNRAKVRLYAEFDRVRDLHIVFYHVDDTELEGLQAWSKYTWYRLLLPSVLPCDIHRVLYLDADTLVCGNLSPLFAMDMDGISVAGVIDPLSEDAETYRRCGYPSDRQYICAGVMMVNLDYWRRHFLQNDLVSWGQAHPDIKFHDQDCINTVCADTKKILPIRFGIIDVLFTIDRYYADPAMWRQLKRAVDRPVIIHYAGKAPWLRDAAVHAMADRWHDTNRRLRRPARMSYKAKGLLKIKIIVHDLIHRGYRRADITLSEIKQRLIDALCAHKQTE